jgi:hypothetical protein
MTQAYEISATFYASSSMTRGYFSDLDVKRMA